MAVETVMASTRAFTRQESASMMGEEEMRENGVMARNREGLINKKLLITSHHGTPEADSGGGCTRLQGHGIQ
jgi:hypothetical protein